ncbi:MAG: hypothetical protein MJ093_07690 [Saccharofermentans sp.]|nr:hypothetical protein [Saccharofermentans sp.]
MFETFRNASRVRRAYSTNSIIYWIKTLPIIGKMVSNSTYSGGVIRTVANVLYILKAIIGFCLGDFIYLLILLGVSMGVSESMGIMTGTEAFKNVYFFLALIGVLLNSYLFDPSEDKYYAINMLRMNPREYVLSDMIYRVIRKFVGYSIMFVIICLLTKLSVSVAVMLVTMTLLGKFLGAFVKLQFVKKNNVGKMSNILVWYVMGMFILGCVVTFVLKLAVSPVVIYIVGGAICLTGIFCFFKLWNYEDYPQTCKYFLTLETVSVKNNKENVEKKNADNSIKVEVNSEEATSNKEGYAYYNDLFVKRHSKLLKKRTTIMCFVLLAMLVVEVVSLFIGKMFFNMKPLDMVSTLLFSMPLIIYYANNGEQLASVMFMNCDNAMLTYNFYRRADVLLGVFRSRLKTVISYNIIPAFLISCCLAVVCAFSSDYANALTYVAIFILCPVLSVFFSVHRLVVYYLLQPYTDGLEKKRSSYSLANYATYFVTYTIFMARDDINLAPIAFSGVSVIFTVIYVLVALLLVYKFAPKRFVIHK